MSTYNTLLPLTYLFTAGTVAASRTYTAQKAPRTLLTITMQETLRYRSQTLRNRYRTLHMVRYLGLHRQHHRIIIFYYFYLWILCILYLIKITSHRYQTMGNIFNLYCYICIYIFSVYLPPTRDPTDTLDPHPSLVRVAPWNQVPERQVLSTNTRSRFEFASRRAPARSSPDENVWPSVGLLIVESAARWAEA